MRPSIMAGAVVRLAVLGVLALLPHSRASVLPPTAAGEVKCPERFILGAQKCGTTTLWSYTEQRLYLSNDGRGKELSIFSAGDESQLPFRSVKQRSDEKWFPYSVDATPAYLRDPSVAPRIKMLCSHSKPKFVVTLCDPAWRTWSAFRHNAKLPHLYGWVSRASMADAFDLCVKTTLPGIRRCLDVLGYERCGHLLYNGLVPGRRREDGLGAPAQCSGLIYSSLYSEQLEHWFGLFPREDFLVLDRDEWTADINGTVHALAEHFQARLREQSPEQQEQKEDHGVMVGNHNVKFAEIEPHPGTIQMLQDFFSERQGWKSMLGTGGHHSQRP